MPSPQDGTAGTLVSPADPDVANDADKADPGQVEETKAEQRETQTGKYGTSNVPAHNDDAEENKDKTSWIEVELIDEDDQPVPGEAVEIELPDGSVSGGTTDDKGKFKVTHFDPGSCKIKFTQLDQEAWEPA